MPPLEDVTAGGTIANLVTTNPADGDDVAQGDDHLRNIKKSLQFTFPNINTTVSASALELDIAHKGGTISGSLVVLGSISASAFGNINATGTLSVSGAAVMKSSLLAETTLTVSGAAVMKSTLDVAGALSASSVNGYQTFAGRVGSSGTAHMIPAGWTYSYSTTAAYRITHNLGDASFTGKHTIILQTIDPAYRSPAIVSQDANNIRYTTAKFTGSVNAIQVFFHFIRTI